MVHRAPDSRLLTNLINHEKEYTKHLAGLFPLSHAAFASLSAYAAASPSSHPASPAHSIAAVVEVLASADDALQRYTQVLDTWREQLVALKDLEDDITAVLRDRDILVTRLIKASKSTREGHRSSRLVGPLATIGSASFSSLPSTNSTSLSLSVSSHSPASTNAKLAQAQTELQACEAHLASKERELDARRITIARDGLGARCRALIDCGWVWGEMGKQGLKVLQALSANSSGLAAPKPSLTVPPRLSTHGNPITYASDNSSLTPSQSASQTAARSIETSHEGPTSNESGHVRPKAGRDATSKPQARPLRTNDDADLTIALPPAHTISESALPTGVGAQNSDPTVIATTGVHTQPTPAPKRKRIKRPRRPPSQHITEVSDEGSNEPASTSHSADTNINTSAGLRELHTSFPVSRAPETHDTSSDDEHPIGSLQVVENDPFEVIRRSMLGPVSASPLLAATTPIARASAPDVRVSAGHEFSSSVAVFQGSRQGQGFGGGIGMGSPSSAGSPRRQRKTSMAFFGSLRGLFRRPRERERLGVDLEEDHFSSSPNQTKASRRAGWVTRTDARIKARGRQEDSDEEVTTTKGVATGSGATTNVVRGASGARLRKGRPGASSVRENGPSLGPSHHTGVDGWVTDSPNGPDIGAGASGGGMGRSRTRQGTMKRKKKSVADLRGSEQGHTDGEIDGGRRSLELVSNKGRAKAYEASVSVSGPKPVVEVKEEGERQLACGGSTSIGASTNANLPADVSPSADANASSGIQLSRATTTTATSRRRRSSDAPPAHRRSASFSSVDAHMTVSSTSTSTQTTPQGMSWRKPPPQIEFSSQQPSAPRPTSPSPAPPQQTQTRTHESQPKQNARRHLGNGHAKHVQNQSLMSVVADVTRQNESQGARVMDKARSLDIPRAPGSVLRDLLYGREVGGLERVDVNGRGHARVMSEDVRGGPQVSQEHGHGQGQGQGQRAIKLPLRSALRNTSRTPSPSPAPVSSVVLVEEVRKEKVEDDRGRDGVPSSLRDSASISSYETGRESLDIEEPGEGVSQSPAPALPSPPPRSQSEPPAPRSSQSFDLRTRSPPPLLFTFPPPPVGPPPMQSGGLTASNANTNVSEPPSSNASTETPPVRRKSVRVSLQPTFTPTPVVWDEDGEGDGAPWHDQEPRQKTERSGPGDVWADSSEEDETYSRARRLLNLVGRGKT